MSLFDRVHSLIRAAMARTFEVTDTTNWPSFSVERPKRKEHGDVATNVAMALSKVLGKPPRVLAEGLTKSLSEDPQILEASVAGPGFVNLRLAPAFFHVEVEEIARCGTAYGRAPAASGERVNVEFVSANPTGPLLVSHGRGAIFGDAVARLLEATGSRVTREYYINDFGNQVRLFAESVLALAEGREVPEDGYKGEYVSELAAYLGKISPEVLSADRELLARASVMWMLRGIPGSRVLTGIRPTLARLGVHFDVWFSEESLHRWGHVEVCLRELEKKGALIRKEGALFFVAQGESEDDKDRVVQKSDGVYTYFASDIAYHADKIGRGYERLINVLGADHHGYVARVKNALSALSLPGERFEALLFQLVFLYRAGEVVKASKRSGNIVTVEEVLDEIDEAAGTEVAGRDALRYFFLSRSENTNVEFDIELAKKKSLENPVFYVQYGHARLCSILRRANELGIAHAGAALAPLTHADELALVSRMSEYPTVLREAAEKREPHRLVFYVSDLVRDFQSYFTRFKTDPILPPDSVRATPGWENGWDMEKTRARLVWISALRDVTRAALSVLGISLPERMQRPAEGEVDE